jgi:ribosome-binding factor A
MSTFRIKRVNELLKQELSKLIRQHLPVEKHGLISVTDVEVSRDLKNANVYVSTVGIGSESQETSVIAALERIRGTLQHEVSRKVVIKYTPHLAFKWDNGLERGQHVVDLLEDLDRKPTDK